MDSPGPKKVSEFTTVAHWRLWHPCPLTCHAAILLMTERIHTTDSSATREPIPSLLFIIFLFVIVTADMRIHVPMVD